MGHVTRQAAIALALGSEHDSTMFSLSPAVSSVSSLGIRVEYCPSYDRPWIAAVDWDSYLRDRLLAIVEEVHAEVLVFDGVVPYRGIGMASRILTSTAFVWLRRGMWKPGTANSSLARSSYFDLVIQPGDLSEESDQGPTAERTDVLRVEPISMLEVVERHTRVEARAALDLPQDRQIVLVTLGSGMLGDVAGPGRVAVDTILRESDFDVAVTKSAVATSSVPVHDSSRVHEISGVYPLVKYLEAFDAAVSSAGYNAVHELIPAGLPVALIANTSTRTDNQTLRADTLAARGLAWAAEDTDLPGVEVAVGQLVKHREPTLREAQCSLDVPNGTTQTAEAVLRLASAFDSAGAGRGQEFVSFWMRIKETIKRLLGEDTMRRIRQLLGRGHLQPGRRTKVSMRKPTDESSSKGALALSFDMQIPSDLAYGEYPFEHLVAESSDAYRHRRRLLIAEYYDVEP
jgi:hypothetical protein